MSTSEAAPQQVSSDLVSGINNLDMIRQAGLMIGLAASVAIGFWTVLAMQEPDYKPLYGSIERLDAKEIGQVLDFNNIQYKVDTNSGALLVEKDRIQDARIKLAEAGVAAGDAMGYELLDKEQPFGTSQFMETTRYRRSLEGELARTIENVNSVRKARVHLAIPKASVFVRDGREPSASVLLDLYPGRGIERHQVRGIANLVAASIPELKTENVTVIDQKGRLLSVGVEDQDLVVAAQHIDYTRKMEKDIVMRIRRLLSPLVGDSGFRAEVKADIDFTEIEQAEESFNPDLPAIREERVINEVRSGNGGLGGIPGALGNQPKQAAAPEVAGPQGDGGNAEEPKNSRSQSTRSYELDRTLSYTKHEKGRLRRLTVAVVVDDRVMADPESGEVAHIPRTPEELERIAVLVKDAVGYSAERGDSVNVLNEAFYRPEEEVVPPLEVWEQPWFKIIERNAIPVLLILTLAILAKKLINSLKSVGARAKAEDESRELAALDAAGVDSFDSLSDETVTLTGGDSLALPSPEESYERQINTVKGLVAEDAGRVAQVVKRWINEE